eukprot:gene2992-biopygen4036
MRVSHSAPRSQHSVAQCTVVAIGVTLTLLAGLGMRVDDDPRTPENDDMSDTTFLGENDGKRSCIRSSPCWGSGDEQQWVRTEQPGARTAPQHLHSTSAKRGSPSPPSVW